MRFSQNTAPQRLRTLRPGAAMLAVGVAVSLFPLPTRAESEADEQRAKALFADARGLMAEGKYESACSLFEQSLSLARGIGTKFNLAVCEEHRRHWLRARALFLEVAQQAREAGQAEREQAARERARGVEAHLSQLTIELDSPGTVLELDEQPLASEGLPGPTWLEVGQHVLTAHAEGKVPWRMDFAVSKEGTLLILTVPKLQQAAATVDSAARIAARPKPSSAPSPTLEGNHAESSTHKSNALRKSTAIVLGGVGLGATLAGIGFGLQYLSNNRDAERVCPTNTACSPDDVAQHDRFVDGARRARTWSYLGFGLGAGALAGAAVLYFGGRTPDVRAAAAVGPDGSFGVSVRRRF